jgi:hypothetical protein
MIRVQYPCKIVSEANLRQHWAKVANRKKIHRTQAWAELSVIYVRPGPGRYTVTLTRIAPRKLDSDNNVSAMKATRDGVADWLGIDDGSAYVEWKYAQEKGKPNEYAVRIEIKRGHE